VSQTDASTQNTIRQRLAALQPALLDISDDSAEHAGHAGAADHRARTGATEGTHFSLTIVSPLFAGQSLVARHRMIYDCLGDLMLTRIHALKIDARTQTF
jgi:BolA family transcriptional regulator, general stress-responsive regulator